MNAISGIGAYQTRCPQMRTFALQWSLHGVYATERAQRYYVSPSQINMGDRPKRKSCLPRRFVEDFCQLREKKDGESGTKTQNRQGFVFCWGCWSGYDAKTAKNSFRGIQSRIRWVAWLRCMIVIIKGITIPSFAWKKMFFPGEGSLEDRGNIFHGQLYRCLSPSISSQLCVQEQILWSLLRPLKCYKLKSCGNK